MSAPEGERFDVFLSHNSADKPAVEEIARKLLDVGIRPWLDKWNLVPGQPWQEAIEDALGRCASCAVFIGPSGVGPWQNEEMRAAVDRRVSSTRSRFPVVPVLLPGAQREQRSRLPTFLVATTWVEFTRSVEDEEAFHRLVSGIRGVEPGPRPGEQVYTGESPYRGLLYFDVAHAPFFFGREDLTEWLLHELRPAIGSEGKTRFLGIVGPSGSGKSSLARAGLVAALQQGGLPGSEQWPVAVCRPGADPLEQIAVALNEAGGGSPTPSAITELVSDLEQSERALHLFTRMLLRKSPEDHRLVLLIDQFEELFTLCADQNARAAVVNNLMHASTTAGGQTLVIVTLRADFYGECSAYPTLAAALSERQVLVGPMQPDQLRKSIERPAQLVGCEFEPGLVDTLVEDIREQPGGLPLLSYTLAELWTRRQGRRLTHAAYQAMGRLAGALERRADEIYEGFSEREKTICRRIFLRLVQPTEAGKLTRRRARLSELTPVEGDTTQLMGVVSKLAGQEARLITVETGAATERYATVAATGISAAAQRRGGPPEIPEYVEVAHEALIRTWGRLQRWLDEDQEFQLWHKRLTMAIEAWDRANRDPESLLRGLLLAEASRWSSARAEELNAEEHDFIRASEFIAEMMREEQEERQRQLQAEQQQRLEAETRRADAERRSARKAKMAAVSMAGLLVAVTAGSVVSWQINKRTRALRLADEARRTGRVELAIQAVRESRMAQAVEALYQTARQEVPALSSDSPVNDVAFNAGRVYVATAHTDGVRLWKSPGAAPVLWNAFNQEAKLPHPGEVLSLTFHPREDLLATATAAGDARVRIWKLGSPQPFWESPSQGADDLNAVDFNRTGSLVAAAARSGKLIVWNAEANTSRSISPPHQATTLAFSPLDDRLAAGFTDGTTIWWNVGADAYQNVPGEDQRGKVHNVAFSPDGKSLAMASANGVWVWETGSGDAPRQVPRAEPRVIQAVAWSPQGDLIAAADANRNVSVLDAASLRQQFSFAVPQLDTLTSLAFQPDPQGAGSRKLAVAGFGGSVRIYELNVDLLLKSLEGK